MDMAETIEQDDSGVTPPDLSHLMTEDDTPVDNRYSERQMRLLCDPLFNSWDEGKPFEALTDVGVFSKPDNESVVTPDFLLSLGVEPRGVSGEKEDCSYFIWLYGKPPNLVVEVVSNKVGGELDRKFEIYQSIGVSYYAVHDPFLRLFRLEAGRYVEYAAAGWMPEIGLGLALWRGEFQDVESVWLRFVKRDGSVVPTARESGSESLARAAEAESRASDAESRASVAESRAAVLETRASEAERELDLLRRKLSDLEGVGGEREPGRYISGRTSATHS